MSKMAPPDSPSPVDVVTGEASSEIEFRIASGLRDRSQAFRLIYQRYVEAGLIRPNPFGLRITRHQLSPDTQVFVGVREGKVACTVSLILDGELGLPMEEIYRDEVALFRRSGKKVSEISCLAFKNSALPNFWDAFIGLNRLLAQFARVRSVDTLLLAAHPRHARIHERLIGFQRIGGLAAYPRVQNQPAVACSLTFAEADLNPTAAYKLIFSKRIPHRNLQSKPISQGQRGYFKPYLNLAPFVPLPAG